MAVGRRGILIFVSVEGIGPVAAKSPNAPRSKVMEGLVSNCPPSTLHLMEGSLFVRNADKESPDFSTSSTDFRKVGLCWMAYRTASSTVSVSSERSEERRVGK